MFKIQILNNISMAGLQQFPEALYQVGTKLKLPDGILLRSHDMHHFDLPTSLKVVGRAGAGVNNIPVAALAKLGIPVLNTPGANANAVRELVMAGMLIASRNIFQAWNYVSHLKLMGDALHAEIEKNKKQFVGFELMGKVLGVVGLGSVGVKVANAALNLGMRVIGFDPTISIGRAWELSSSVQQAKTLDELLAHSDFVSVHVPLAKETKNMINASCFKQMKKATVLLNFAREEIVDIDALLLALQTDKLFAYVSDFPNNKLLGHSKVIALPHLGASTREAEENCAVMIVKAVRDFLEYGTITHSANFPALEAPYNGASGRLMVVNQNIPNMVAQISSILAKAKINIASMVNQSRDEIAYNIIDFNNNVNNEIIQAISDIKGVIQVRKLYPLPLRR